MQVNYDKKIRDENVNEPSFRYMSQHTEPHAQRETHYFPKMQSQTK